VLKNKVVGHFVEDLRPAARHRDGAGARGSYVNWPIKAGLASLTGSQMRAAARASARPRRDEAADFLAAQISGGFGQTTGAVSANFLAKDTDAALALLFDVLRRPRFEQARLDLARSQALQAMERRNDSTDAIEGREWARLMRGEHFSTRPTTKAGLEAITRDDLVAFHTTWVHPGNFVLAVSGDFDTTAMIAKLDTLMAGWAAGTKAPPVPKPTHVPVPGVYLIDKPDVNQGRVSLGHLVTCRATRTNMRSMMNDILGDPVHVAHHQSRAKR
jgi:zinc protease